MNLYICRQKNVYKNFHSSVIPNSSKMETTKMPLKSKIDTLLYVHTTEPYIVIKMNKLLPHTTI